MTKVDLKADLYVDFVNLFKIQLNCRKSLDAAKLIVAKQLVTKMTTTFQIDRFFTIITLFEQNDRVFHGHES